MKTRRQDCLLGLFFYQPAGDARFPAGIGVSGFPRNDTMQKCEYNRAERDSYQNVAYKLHLQSWS